MSNGPMSRGAAAAGSRNSAVVTPPERALPGARLAQAEPGAAMRIGEVAERIGLSMRSLRYYDETGLVTPSARTSGGFRLYSEADVQRLLLVMQMKPLDFTLDEMRAVIDDLTTLAAGAPASHDPASGAPPASEVDAARERLEQVRLDVEERYASARQRLEIASMFREHLAAELGEAPTPPS